MVKVWAEEMCDNDWLASLGCEPQDTPPGIMTPTDIFVVGPVARHVEDLDLALRAESADHPQLWIVAPSVTGRV